MGDLRELGQWCPITLLPTFYEIIAKALAARLKPFMDALVEEEQRGFVAGRSIADNLFLFREAKWHVYASRQKVTFLQLDYSKAYDRMEWFYLFVVLRALGFRRNFIQWVEILCKDATARLIINGEISRALGLGKSVHQGCPLVPYLFVLAADLFLLMMKAHPDIKGLELPGDRELKAMAVADDSQVVFATTAKSLDAYAMVIRIFCLFSGMLVNWLKTIAICCPTAGITLQGLLSHVRSLQLGEAHKYLRVDHEAGGEDKCIGPQLVSKLHKKCQQLQSPFHSLAARVVIVNTPSCRLSYGTIWLCGCLRRGSIKP